MGSELAISNYFIILVVDKRGSYYQNEYLTRGIKGARLLLK